MAGSSDAAWLPALGAALALVVGLGVAGCGGDGGSGGTAEDGTPDAGLDVADPGGRDGSDDAPEDAPDATPDADALEDVAGDAGPRDARDGDAADASADGGEAVAPDALPSTTEAACDSDGDCALTCAPDGACVDGVCAYEAPEGCVVSDEAGEVRSCEAPWAAHTAGCLVCNPAVSRTAWTARLLAADLEGGAAPLDDVEVSGAPGATWAWSDARAGSGAGSLYFGDGAHRTYDVAGRAWATVLGPTLEVPPEAALELRFLLWLETEQTPGFDVLRAFVVDVETGARVDVWTSDAIGGTTGGVFLPFVADVDVGAARRVRVGFEFDSVDHLANGHEGAYVDRVVLAGGCCASGADCDDGDACTTDSCEGGACERGPVEGCCNVAADCDDGDPCTVDACSEPGGTCSAEPVPGCCLVGADCDDGDPCTEDRCPAPGEACVHQPLCCAADADCDDGDACTAGACVEGQCLYESVCCASDAACDDGTYCTRDRCIGGECVHEYQQIPGCCTPDIHLESFDAGDPEGWTFSPKNLGVGWQVASVGAPPSPPGALYYGNPAAGNYATPSANKGSATSPPVHLPQDVAVTLSMRIYMDTESGNGYDKIDVVALTDGGEIDLVTKSDLEQEHWNEVEVDLSYLQGQTLRLRFDFNTVDNTVNSGLGVLVDDLALTTTCAPKACQGSGGCASRDPCVTGACDGGACVWSDACCATAADCDDGDVCTEDACAAGFCDHTPVPGCCEELADCDDGDPCTVDACSGFGGQCSHEVLEGCCVTHEQCDDADACTTDVCVSHICTHEEVCCDSDAECDDGDDVCTDDACVDGACVHTPTGLEECCEQAPLAWSFEQPVGFMYSATAPPCGWQIAEIGESVSGSHALYYGDPNGGDYDCGPSAGTARSPVIELPAGARYTLRLHVLMDTQALFSVDQLSIRAVAVGGVHELPLLSKPDVKTGAWETHEVDVSALGGMPFRLVFRFDTVDGAGNDGLGVLVDDVTIESTCAPAPCEVPGDCEDGLYATQESCEPDGCAWEIQ